MALRHILALSVIAACLPARAGVSTTSPEVFQPFAFNENGTFEIDGILFYVGHFGAQWNHATQKNLTVEAGYPSFDASGDSWETRGALSVAGSEIPLTLTQDIRVLPTPGLLQGTWQVTHPGLPTQEVALETSLPVDQFAGRIIRVDGTPYELMASLEDGTNATIASGQHVLSLPLAGGVLTFEGYFSVRLQDNRLYGGNTYNLRLRFSPVLYGNSLTSASLQMSARYEPYVFNFSENGTFEIDGILFYVGHFGAQWNHTTQKNLTVEAGYPSFDASGDSWETRGALSVAGSEIPLTLTQDIRVLPIPSLLQGTWQVTHPGLPTQEVALETSLPVDQFAGRIIRVDGTPYELMASLEDGTNATIASGQHVLSLPLAGGVLVFEGCFSVRLQDNRIFGSGNTYNLRLRFSPVLYGNPLTSASLQVSARYEPYQSVQLPLGTIVNRSFRDEVAGDGQGGWTDQGQDNDLASMQPGLLQASHVIFDIIDPSANDDRAALVLGQVALDLTDIGEAVDPAQASTETTSVPPLTSATLNVNDTNAYHNLYLLHAAASSLNAMDLVGTITIHYADGTESSHEVLNDRDVGNWRNPFPCPNASIAWLSENPTATIGLYVSCFPIEHKEIYSLTFEHSGEGAWMIVGLAASTQDIPVNMLSIPFEVEAGDDWAPYSHSLDIASGSVFDFSSQLDAPAGKYGALIVSPEGKFEFEQRPGQRVRFWGVNLCFSAQYLEQAEADALAERLARSGYNTVRLHHFDRDLVVPNADSWELDPVQLDKLDYLFAALKNRGIYINIDLYSSRKFSPVEEAAFGVPAGQGVALFKSVLPISEAAFDSWKRFTDNLLNHYNPYTGSTWAEDPALIGICPVNENPLFNRVERDPDILARYEAAFSEAYPSAGTASGPDFNIFIYETNILSDARMGDYIRSLGCRALITGANYTISQGLTYVRQYYDYVDNHAYWDHPQFPGTSWALPYIFGQYCATERKASIPARIMPTRIFGLPFTVTEFHFCRPNQYRAEDAVLMPAYASLQDWDALYNFQYAMSRDMALDGSIENYFALASDPISLITDRVSSFLFKRGDIAPAQYAVVYAVRPEEAFTELGRLFPTEFNPIGLVSRIGSLPGNPAEILAADPGLNAAVIGISPTPTAPLPAQTYLAEASLAQALQQDGVLPAGSVNDEGTRFVSDTRQIELRSDERTVIVVTPWSELFYLAPKSQLQGDRISVANGTTECSIAVVALDDLPLSQTRRVLVTHLTDSLPEGAHFSNYDRKMLESWGTGPHLVRKGDAEIALRLAPGNWQAWAVDATGTRQNAVSLQTGEDNSLLLNVSTVTGDQAHLAYELAR